jgi:hypothetical protein
MVAVTGRAKLEPIMELAMSKANERFLAKHRRYAPMIARAHNE